MRPTSLCLYLIAALIAICFIPSNGHYVSAEGSDLSYKHNLEEPIRREKRQMENFDDEYTTTANQDAQEEPSFWDRVVKVALKLFSRFVEWLNS